MNTCKRCEGKGFFPDPSTFAPQIERIGVREMARRMALSPSYLSDLKLGKRTCTWAMAKKINSAVYFHDTIKGGAE